MTLQEFLNNNVVEGATKEVIVSDRFKDENGNILKFKIKAFSQRELEEARKRAATTDKKGKVNFNDGLFNTICITENTLEPNFKDAESLRKLNCNNAQDYLNKVLLPGEIEQLARKIFEFSGFGQNINELIEEAKN